MYIFSLSQDSAETCIDNDDDDEDDNYDDVDDDCMGECSVGFIPVFVDDDEGVSVVECGIRGGGGEPAGGARGDDKEEEFKEYDPDNLPVSEWL